MFKSTSQVYALHTHAPVNKVFDRKRMYYLKLATDTKDYLFTPGT